MTEALPKIGAGAVVWRGDEVLLIRRGKEPRKGEWSLPGGGVERGETLHAATLREVLEETGCVCEIVGLCDVAEWIDPGWHFVLIDFTARWLSGEPVAGDDAADARFVTYEQAMEMVASDVTRRMIASSRAQILNA